MPRVLSKVIAWQTDILDEEVMQVSGLFLRRCTHTRGQTYKRDNSRQEKRVERCSFEILHEICVLYTLYTVRMSLEQGISPIKSGEKSRRFVRAIAFDEPTNKHTRQLDE